MATVEQEQLEGARTQSLFREVNERIEALTLEQRFVDGEVLCECASEDCAEAIPLTFKEYDAVRRVPTHFLVSPGHDVPEIERVIEKHERYFVVEKFGESGKVAAKLDPRRRRSERPDPS